MKDEQSSQDSVVKGNGCVANAPPSCLLCEVGDRLWDVSMSRVEGRNVTGIGINATSTALLRKEAFIV